MDDTLSYFNGLPIGDVGDESVWGCAVLMRTNTITRQMVGQIASRGARALILLCDDATVQINTSAWPLSIPVVRVSTASESEIRSYGRVSIVPYPFLDETPFRRATFSGIGPTFSGMDGPTICAPGNHYIWSSRSLGGNVTQNTTFDGGLTNMGGTSMATPAVSGLIALFREWLRKNAATPTPTSYLLRALVIASARPLERDSSRVLTGYGHPRLTRLPGIVFRDRESISEESHKVYTLNIPSSTEDVHIVLSYLDRPLSSDAIYPLWADLDLAVVAPDGAIYRGNNLVNAKGQAGTYFDPFATNEKVVIPANTVGTFKIHITSSIYPMSGAVPFALAVSGATNAVLSEGTVTDTCAGPTPIGASCKAGLWQCKDGYAGSGCDATIEKVAPKTEISLSLNFKEIKWIQFTREAGKEDGVRFDATKKTGVSRGIAVCLCRHQFQRIADPEVACVNDMGVNIQDPLWFPIEDGDKDMELWAAIYCVSNQTCSVGLKWQSADQRIFGMSIAVFAIIVIVVVVVIVVCIVLAVYCCCCRKKKDKSDGDLDGSSDTVKWNLA
jgi:hypothetical protein